jgi:hypothetical protein
LIEETKAGCACSSLELSQKMIPAGGEATLTVSAHVRADGENNVFPVRIVSNDPATPETLVIVRLTAAAPLIQADPKSLNFGEVPAGTAPVRPITLTIHDNHLATESKDHVVVTATGGLVLTEVQPPPKDDAKAVKLEVRPRADLPLGRFADRLSVSLALGQCSMEILVEGEVVPRVVAAPRSVYFGKVDKDAAKVVTRDFLLRSTDGRDIPRLVKVEAPPGLTVEEEAGTTPANTRRLRLTLDAGSVTEDVKDGRVLLWLEGDADPVAVGVLIFVMRSGS